MIFRADSQRTKQTFEGTRSLTETKAVAAMAANHRTASPLAPLSDVSLSNVGDAPNWVTIGDAFPCDNCG